MLPGTPKDSLELPEIPWDSQGVLGSPRESCDFQGILETPRESLGVPGRGIPKDSWNLILINVAKNINTCDTKMCYQGKKDFGFQNSFYFV